MINEWEDCDNLLPETILKLAWNNGEKRSKTDRTEEPLLGQTVIT